MSAPAPDSTDANDDYEYAPDDSEYEPEPDPRPRGLHVVGGRASGPAYSPPASPEPESGGFELPGFLKKARQLAEDIKPLTAREAAAVRDGMVKAFMRFWKYGDEAISATNAERAEAHIWTKIDQRDTEIIVDFLIERGKESAAAAQIARGISNIWNYYAVGLILGPRFVQSFKFYAEHGGFTL